MNVIDALIAHHEELRKLFQDSMNDPAVFEEFARHLTIHHTMEEKYFYDLLQEKAQARHDALEAVNEHHIIEMIMHDADGFPRDHENFGVKIEGLGEYTSHHLDEEEEEIFPAAGKLFAAEELDTLGALFDRAKNNLLGVDIPAPPDSIGAQRGSDDLGIGSLKQS